MKKIQLKLRNKKYNVFVAKELGEWKEGLKGSKIYEVDGILMTFSHEHIVNITMNGVLENLDIFWVDKNKVIVKVMQNVNSLKESSDF